MRDMIRIEFILIVPFLFLCSMKLKVCTLNVRGTGNATKREALSSWMIKEKIDILALQETYVTVESSQYWKYQFTNHDIYHSYGTNHSRGVSIIVSKSCQTRCTLEKTDVNGRYVILKIHGDYEICLATIYAPVLYTERETFLTEMTQELLHFRNHIICGDFNCVIDPRQDKVSSSPSKIRSTSTNTLSKFIVDLNLDDVYRRRNPDVPGFTWTQQHTGVAERIDMFLVSKDISHDLSDISVTPVAFSDHSSVVMSIRQTTNVARGQPYWKFNTSFLKEERFRNLVTALWEHWRHQKDRFDTILDWWDSGKSRIRELCIKYGIRRHKKRTKHRRKIEISLRKADLRIQKGDLSSIRDVNKYKSLLNQLDREEIHGSHIRSRMTWLERGETSQKFSISTERRQAGKHQFRQLKTLAETMATTSDQLLSTVREFYGELYKQETTSPTAIRHILSNINTTLNEDDRQSCEGPLSLEELTASMRQLKTGKAPGLDGIPVEFYSSFWNCLMEDFAQMASEVRTSESLTPSQRTGVIRLLYKRGDRENLANWRPISLLNTDYKIMSRALANRLKDILPGIIHPNQTCCILKRTISDNCATVRDILQHCQTTKTPAAIISLDQEKAFDRVDWQYLYTVLERFGFGPSFIGWIKILYNDIGSNVIVNNWLTARIPIGRGVRQGCPLSPMLYVLTLEPLAAAIRANASIEGIYIPETQHSIKMSIYADDTTCFVSNTEGFTALDEELQLYGSASGARLNRTKSKGLWLGSWQTRQDTPLHIDWALQSIKILGLTFTRTYFNTVFTNWRDILQKLKAVLAVWKKRDMSLYGRASVLKRFALSKVYYAAHVFTMPQYVVKQFEKEIWSFVWKERQPLVKRGVCISPTDCGGLGVPHLLSRINAIQMQCLRRLFTATFFTDWMHYAFYWYKNIGGMYKLGIRAFGAAKWKPSGRLIAVLPPFYRHLLQLWHKWGGGRKPVEPHFYEEACAEPLWGNDLIKDNHNCPLYYPSLARSGYATIHDFYTRPRPPSNTISHSIYPILCKAIPEHWQKLPTTTSSVQNKWMNELYWFIDKEQPIPLREATTKTVYKNLRIAGTEKPLCYERWAAVMTISDAQWKTLWSVPTLYLTTPYQKDIFWKTLHRALPTQHRLFICGISDSDLCLSCNQQIETFDHVFTDCPKWTATIRTAQYLLCRMGIKTTPQPHALKYVLTAGTASIKAYYSILLITYWMKRTTLPACGIIAAFTYHLRSSISANRWRTVTSTCWEPLARIQDGGLIFHDAIR